jgi:hypothetical protein
MEPNNQIGAQLVSWSPSGNTYALAQDKTLAIYTPDGKVLKTMEHATPILTMSWLRVGTNLSYLISI